MKRFHFCEIILALLITYSLRAEVVLENKIRFNYFPVDNLIEHSTQSEAAIHNRIKASALFRNEKDNLLFESYIGIHPTFENRFSLDIPRFSYTFNTDLWEIKGGLETFNWGVLETVSLSDFINSRDHRAELPEGRKLGQPFLSLERVFLDEELEFQLTYLPYFRVPLYRKNPDRFTVLLNQPETKYYKTEKTPKSFTFRVLKTLNQIDWTGYYFYGKNRIPELELYQVTLQGPEFNLVNLYTQILGSTIQATFESFILKAEVLNKQDEDAKHYWQYGYGGEYIIPAFWGPADLNLITEYYFDSRSDSGINWMQNDLSLGLKVSLNDYSLSELELAYIRDLEFNSQVTRCEFNRLIGSNWKAGVQSLFFKIEDSQDVLHGFKFDTMLSLSLTHTY